jgi:hypothetical protein
MRYIALVVAVLAALVTRAVANDYCPNNQLEAKFVVSAAGNDAACYMSGGWPPAPVGCYDFQFLSSKSWMGGAGIAWTSLTRWNTTTVGDGGAAWAGTETFLGAYFAAYTTSVANQDATSFALQWHTWGPTATDSDSLLDPPAPSDGSFAGTTLLSAVTINAWLVLPLTHLTINTAGYTGLRGQVTISRPADGNGDGIAWFQHEYAPGVEPRLYVCYQIGPLRCDPYATPPLGSGTPGGCPVNQPCVR